MGEYDDGSGKAKVGEYVFFAQFSELLGCRTRLVLRKLFHRQLAGVEGFRGWFFIDLFVVDWINKKTLRCK